MPGCGSVRRTGACIIALVLLLAACSNGDNGNVAVQRVVTTAGPETTVLGTDETATPEATRTKRPRSTKTVATPTITAAGEGTAPPVETATPSTPQPTTDTNVLATQKIALTHVADVARPTAMAFRHNDSAMYIASKTGQVSRLVGQSRKVVLDISSEVSGGSEQGLLGLAFAPSGTTAVINFTNKSGTSVTRAYRYDSANHVFGQHKNLFAVQKPTAMHNGGNVAFGPDGYLYVSIGDGGLSGDPDNNAQSLATFLGKILRVDVESNLTYDVPSSNPFVGRDGKDEIWAYGFRNPWRFSFDKSNGSLWISDVGRDRREEIDLEPAGAGGRNYGWNRMEWSIPYEGRTPPAGAIPPVYDYEHSDTRCVVIGGYAYRGSRIPKLNGAFLFTDYCAGGIEALRIKDSRVIEHRHFKISGDHISSFGQGPDGEVYALALVEGAIYRIDPR